jgi:RNA polymerase sigma-54 factor
LQLRQDNSQRQAQVQKIGPHLIHANAMLQCTNTELIQLIEKEQQENPALEGADTLLEATGGCAFCPGGGQCSNCPYSRAGHPLATTRDAGESAPPEQFTFMMGGTDDGGDDGSANREIMLAKTTGNADGMNGASSDFDPIMLAQAPSSLHDQLLSHLRASAKSPKEAQILEFLVDSLDDRGYLQINMDEACAVLRATEREIEAGVLQLQASDPPGIGGRNLRECLLLQMQYLRDEDEAENLNLLAEIVVRDHWELLTQRRFPQLARRTDSTTEEIEQALEFIRQKLSPHPAAQFRQPWDHRPDSGSMPIRPDVIILRGTMGFKIEISGLDNLSLHINPHYNGLYDEIRSGRKAPASVKTTTTLTPEHEKHVVAYVERANLFIKNLQRRKRTIQRIAITLVEHQQGFLETGNKSFLRPLTRTQIAQELSMHESTISRALLHKFVQLPSQEVVSFDIFFGTPPTAKEAIAQLIAEENPTAPLSDQAIVEELTRRGLSVARRTVVKYRDELRIPASYLRKKR